MLYIHGIRRMIPEMDGVMGGLSARRKSNNSDGPVKHGRGRVVEST